MVDFPRLITVAQRLISENGRAVTLVEFDSTLQNTARPWLGPADPRAAPDSSLPTDAVFVEPSSAVRLGISTEASDLIKNAEQVMIISAGAQVDLSIFQEVIDADGSRWKVQATQTLRPGSTTVVGFIGVSR